MIVYTVRVHYIGGKTEEFECLNFSSTIDERGQKSFSWAVYGNVLPIDIGAEYVESVWQIGARIIPDETPSTH